MRVMRRKRSAPVTLVLCALAATAVLVPGPDGPVRESEEVDRDRGYRIHRNGPLPPTWPAASRDSRCWQPKTRERGFFQKLNAARERGNRNRLRLDPEISKVARKHAREMRDRSLLYHTTEDALRRRVTFWSILGENVGVGATVNSLHVAFMNSPAHRDNIMHGSFRHAGVGTTKALGRLWVTVIFQASDNPGTTLRMPRC